MAWQSDINPVMREMLVSWMIEISPALNLKKQTLYLAVFILDKYSHCRYVSKDRYQLLGISCLFVAAKYE